MPQDAERSSQFPPPWLNRQAIRQLPVSPPQPLALRAPTAIPPARLLTNAREAAAALAISQRKLWALTEPRGPIPCIRIGRAVRYDLCDLRGWIAAEKAAADERH